MIFPTSPCIQVWRFTNAPDSFRALTTMGDGSEELVIYIPPELLDSDGEFETQSVAPWFLNRLPKYPGHQQYAGDDWGWYSLHELPDGGRVAITGESVALGGKGREKAKEATE